MRKSLYARLAVRNLVNNRRHVTPYLLSAVGTVMMFFIMETLAFNPGLAKLYGGEYITVITGLGARVIALFSAIFLIYSYSFLMKRRSMEFGLFQMLGMEKKHVTVLLLYETLALFVLALGGGVVLGILLYRIMYLLLLRLTGLTGTVSFFFSPDAFVRTTALFGILFFMNFLFSVFRVRSARPVELLHGGEMGEREPRAKAIVVLAGLFTMGAGYYLAITCETGLEAFSTFFIAVVLVGIGTHCLFSAGSIALLKFLKRRKGFCYQPRHFISVSGMLYRMKQNAAGLANICILSTGVLLVISITACLWGSKEAVLAERYPAQISVRANQVSGEAIGELEQALAEAVESCGEKPVRQYDIRVGFYEAKLSDDQVEPLLSLQDALNSDVFYFMTLEEYERCTGVSETLAPGSVLVAAKENYLNTQIRFGERAWSVVPSREARPMPMGVQENLLTPYVVVFPDFAEMKEAYEGLGASWKGEEWTCWLDFDADEEEQRALGARIREAVFAEAARQKEAGVRGEESSIWCEIREENRDSVSQLYGGVLFFGIFVGLLFLMATVLIIYYKQLSEGYDDRKRFIIMQNVGLGSEEVRSAIRSQVLMVFFLPLLTAVVHTAVAFPFTVRLMQLMNFTNTRVFILATILTVLVFSAVYLAVYLWTARVYYQIVRA